MTNTATVVDDNVVRSLQARWSFVFGKYVAAREARNTDEMEVFGRKLVKLTDEAKERGLDPDRLAMVIPGSENEVQAKSRMPRAEVSRGVGAIARPKEVSKPTPSKPKSGPKAKQTKVDKAKEMTRRVKLHKSKGTPKLLPCLCGCGESVEGDFARGHNKNLLAIIHRIEQGKGKLKDIPKVAEPYTKFVKRNNRLVCVTAPVYVGPGINMVARTKR